MRQNLETAPENVSEALLASFARTYPHHRFAVIEQERRFGHDWQRVWTGRDFALAAAGHHLMEFADAVATQRNHGGEILMVRVRDSAGLACCYSEAKVRFWNGQPWAYMDTRETA